jgi:hypothetical protein
MPEREARTRAVYDHDKEEPRPAGRRRRQVADWGVGEELFDGMPGRRFDRRPHRESRAEAPRIDEPRDAREEAPREDFPRGDAADGRRTIVIETGDGELPLESLEPAEEDFASRDEALRAREADDELWAGDEPFADREPEPVAEASTYADEALAADAAALPPFEELDRGADLGRADGVVRGGQEGRRTVKIGGRPAEFYGPPARARQRPPRSVHERLGPRPERIAAWAFALGILLILIAIATSQA